MSQPPPTRRRKLTALAEKYKHPTGRRNEVLLRFDDFKSGLTPIPKPVNIFTQQDRTNYLELLTWQTKNCKGFTTSELHACEAFAPTNDKYDSIILLPDNTPIHPFFGLEKWDPPLLKHLAKFPLGGGRQGYWEAKNPVVWDVIQPSLRLVSKLFANAHIFPWWDALLFGEYHAILADNLPERYRDPSTVGYFASFKLRSPLEYASDEARTAVEKEFLKVVSNFHMCFMSARIGDGATLNSIYSYGIGLAEGPFGQKPVLQLAFELVEPLLSLNLNVAERTVEIFRIADTILHESAHLFWLAHLSKQYRDTDSEPFFEDEVITELGFSVENASFGGHAAPTVTDGGRDYKYSRPAAGIFQCDWNTFMHDDYSPDRPTLLSQPPAYNVRNQWAIPCAYFVSLQDTGFWNYHVRKFGAKAIEMGPKSMGRRREKPPGMTSEEARSQRKIQEFLDFISIQEYRGYVQLPINRYMDLPTIAATQMENTRREQGARIFVKAENHTNDLIAITNYLSTAKLQTQVSFQPTETPEPRSFATCSRFDEIRQYLFYNRMQLALDTMSFIMPEHTMHNYILKNGGLLIDPNEWRDFLLVCNQREILFTSHTDLGPSLGTILRNPEGWPTTAAPPRPRPPYCPSRSIIAAFQAYAQVVIDESGAFRRGFLDHDLEDFRLSLDFVRNRRKDPVDTSNDLINGFTTDIVDGCLWEFNRRNKMFNFGPNGIIRLLTENQRPGVRERIKDACPTQ